MVLLLEHKYELSGFTCSSDCYYDFPPLLYHDACLFMATVLVMLDNEEEL